MLKEGIYEDFERRDALLKLARFKSTASGDEWRSLRDYVAALKPNQAAIYYLAGDDIARLQSSPHLEGFRARGIEVLLLPDPVDSFWVMPGVAFEGKPFKSVTQGAADLASIPLTDTGKAQSAIEETVKQFLAFVKITLGDEVAEVRASERLTDSAVCLVASESGPDRALEQILAGAGRLRSASKPILEVNPHHRLVVALAALGGDERGVQGRCRASAVRRSPRARRRPPGGRAGCFPSGWRACWSAACRRRKSDHRRKKEKGRPFCGRPVPFRKDDLFRRGRRHALRREVGELGRHVAADGVFFGRFRSAFAPLRRK